MREIHLDFIETGERQVSGREPLTVCFRAAVGNIKEVTAVSEPLEAAVGERRGSPPLGKLNKSVHRAESVYLSSFRMSIRLFFPFVLCALELPPGR